MSRKISESTALTGTNVAVGDLLPIVDISDTTDAASGTTKKITVPELDEGLRAKSKIKRYRASIAQTEASAPSATVIENTLGGTVVWSRSGVGTYDATLAGVFTQNKTFVLATAAFSKDGAENPQVRTVSGYWLSANICQFVTSVASGTPSDGSAFGQAFTVQVEVHP